MRFLIAQVFGIENDSFYSYGGIFERGSKEYTLDDFYALQLDKLDKFLCLKPCDVVIPVDGDDMSSSDDDDDDDDDDSDSDSDEDNDVGDSNEVDDGMSTSTKGRSKPSTIKPPPPIAEPQEVRPFIIQK